MLIEDYWLDLKYYISGLELLVEIASEDEISRNGVLYKWFNDEFLSERDELYTKLYKTAEIGIRLGRAKEDVFNEMIESIPSNKRHSFDSMGYTFSAELMGNSFEKIYSDIEHKYKWRRIYEGLLPGNEFMGLRFADLAFRHNPSEETGIIETYCNDIGMITWGKSLSNINDDDIVILASDMSRGGRLFLLAGLPDDRVYEMIRKTILFEMDSHDAAANVARKLLNEITRHCYHLQK